MKKSPVKANMCKKVSSYCWSGDLSYRKNLQNQLVDIDFVLDIFSLDRKVAIGEYIKFMDSSELEESSNFEDINTDESDPEMLIPFIIKEKLKTRQVLQL